MLMRRFITGRRVVVAALPAAAFAVLQVSAAWACTIYQGTWTVCGDMSSYTTCVTSTGNGQAHGFTTSGSTSATQSVAGGQTGSVKVTAAGLKAGATYKVNFLDPVGVGDGLDCMSAVAIGGPFTATGGAFGPTAALNLPVSTTGTAAVCAAEQTPSLLGTGNEVPVTILAGGGVDSRPSTTTPQWNNYHQPQFANLRVCQDGNWDSDQIGSYQREMSKWDHISAKVPTVNVVGTDCSVGAGKLWRQTTSSCEKDDPNWIGCLQPRVDSSGQITYFDLTINNNYCYSTIGNVFAYGQCFDRDTVIGHEAGHSLGLGHNTVDNRSIMWTGAPQDTLPDARSDPDSNDAARIIAIYG